MEEKIKDIIVNYRENLYKNPKLKYLFFEFTTKCNLNCLHCGSACDNNAVYLPKEYIFKVLESIKRNSDASEILLCVTGGEPLLHPDFFEIIEKFNQLGFSWGITTNGTLITEQTAQKIINFGLSSISVSLDGDEVLHDFLRNAKHSFKSAVNGIKALQNAISKTKKAVAFDIITVIHKQNVEKIEKIYEVIKDLKINRWRLTNIEPIGRANAHPELMLEGEEYKKLFTYIQDKRKNQCPIYVSYGCSHYLTEQFERKIREHYFLCLAGTQVASITANGDIIACLDIERRADLIQGNVQKDDFWEIWQTKFDFFRQDKSKLCNECKNCEHAHLCAGDSAHTWDYDKNKPRLCLAKKN